MYLKGGDWFGSWTKTKLQPEDLTEGERDFVDSVLQETLGVGLHLVGQIRDDMPVDLPVRFEIEVSSELLKKARS